MATVKKAAKPSAKRRGAFKAKAKRSKSSKRK